MNVLRTQEGKKKRANCNQARPLRGLRPCPMCCEVDREQLLCAAKLIWNNSYVRVVRQNFLCAVAKNKPGWLQGVRILPSDYLAHQAPFQ